MKLIYLDFDGVLHDDEVYFKFNRRIRLETPGRTLFEWMPILENLIEPHPDVQIVLSTSWVRLKSFSFAKSKLSKTLRDRVIGSTFHRGIMQDAEFVSMSRGMQIWSDVIRRKPDAWCALDNDTFGWPAWCRDQLIETEDSVGISCPYVQERLRNALTLL
jgi:hypothetical protein